MGAADLADLAFGSKFAQTTKRLGRGRLGIRSMQLVVIDVVGSQAGQAGVEPSPDLRGIAAPFPLGQADGVAPFAGHEDLVTAALDRLPQIFLGQTCAVTLCGIEVVDAGIDRCVNNLLRPFGIEPHTEVVTAQSDDRNL